MFEHHLAYKQERKRDVSQREFADYIGVPPDTYGAVFRGAQPPTKELVRKLAEFFDDLRFYDAAQMKPPDPRLHMVNSYWDEINNEDAKRIAEIIEPYRTGKKKKK